jgi:hypothetical protein
VGGASGWSSTPLGPGYLFVNPAVLQLCRLDAAAVFTPAPLLHDKVVSGSQDDMVSCAICVSNRAITACDLNLVNVAQLEFGEEATKIHFPLLVRSDLLRT